MRYFKKIISFILIVILAVSVSSCGNRNNVVDPEEDPIGQPVLATKHDEPKEIYTLTFDEAIGKDVMPVGAYGGPHSKEKVHPAFKDKEDKVMIPSMITKEYFDLYEQMGLNYFTSTVKDGPEAEEFLTRCDEYNMAAFLTFDDLRVQGTIKNVSSTTVNKNFDKYKDHKSLIGYYLRDEPNADLIRKMARYATALNESKYSHKLAYGNAMPSYPGEGAVNYDKAGSSMTWKQYLQLYCETLDVKFLSFDYYPWIATDDGTPKYRPGYIEAISMVREVANEFKIPYWSCKQTTSVMEWKDLSAQAMTPNENQFRWQMALDLAYGVKGITYFVLCGDNMAYSAPERWEEGMDDYFGIINGYTGETNVWFDYIKNYKGHIQLVDEILMNSYHDGIIAHGSVIEKTDIGKELIKSGTYYELIGVEGAASLIGCFNYKGQTVLYVTNSSYSKENQITLNFDNNYKYDVYQGDSVTEKIGKSLTLDFLPGEGVMVMPKY